jgi:hypothetical protein
MKPTLDTRIWYHELLTLNVGTVGLQRETNVYMVPLAARRRLALDSTFATL